MTNPNTSTFWDRKIQTEIGVLRISPIYNHKNIVVIKWLENFSGKLLNIGVGYGILEKLLKNNRPDFNLYGVDISKESILNAKKSIGKNFIFGNIKKLPFQDGYFDCVLALDILEHLRTKEFLKALSEISRVLKPEGIFIASIPLNESLNDKANNRHMISFTASSFNGRLEKHGFQINKCKLLYAFRSWYFFKSLINNILRLREPNLLIVSSKKR